MSKTNPGNYFEDFFVGQELVHASPRTVSLGDVSLYTALFGTRFAVQSSDVFAKAIGYSQAPLDDMLVFHMVFGKTVPDISLNAIANLGYADCRFLKPVYPGSTFSTVSDVIGVKQNTNGKTGVVYVRSTGRDETGDIVLQYVRWVMVRKKDPSSPAPEPQVPDLPAAVAIDQLGAACPVIDPDQYDDALAGSAQRFHDYEVGEKIDHVDGMTIEEAEHMIAARLFQNTAKVHFNKHTESQGRFGKRIIYGGHILSLARALSFNGLNNAFHIAAINGGRHVNPCFAGDTVYAWSEVLDKGEIPGRSDVGALRLRTFAVKDQACSGFPGVSGDGYDESVLLDLDYWVLMPI